LIFVSRHRCVRRFGVLRLFALVALLFLPTTTVVEQWRPLTLFTATTVLAQSGRPPAPTNLVARPGNRQVTLTWTPSAGATSYRVFRSTTGTFGNTQIATVSGTTYTNTGLTNGTKYYYRLVARNNRGSSPPSATVDATPFALPGPETVSAVGGDRQVSVSWSAVSAATSYKVYRSLESNSFSSTPTATVPGTSNTFVDTGLENGPGHYYSVIAVTVAGDTSRSPEAMAFTEGPALVVDDETKAAYRVLRQSTWGPRPGDVDRLKLIGRDAFLDEQFAAASSVYPDTLLTAPVERVQEHVIQLALTGADQLRQRVAWALHKIWVVSANDPNAALGMAAYQRVLLEHAFGNYRDLMEAMTLNPAMGRYLTMLNNRSQMAAGAPANENYARELMQLFAIGPVTLNADGTEQRDADGQPLPTYTQDDVAALARIFTGWTFGDGNPAVAPTALAAADYGVPMEPVAAFHDTTAKTFLGENFPPGATAAGELDRALDLLFNHPNAGPFVAGQLIKQLVTSNPSPGYLRDVAAVFDDNGAAVRGDLRAVVRAILVHPEAAAEGANAGKLAEPLVFLMAMMRGVNATTADPRQPIDQAMRMGQRLLFPPSVFSYFSPRYTVRGTAEGEGVPLTGPEFQTLTSVTAIERANVVAEVVSGLLNERGIGMVVDLTPFSSRARDGAALADYCNQQLLGGRMTSQERAEIVDAIRKIALTSTTERARTALYLTFASAQYQVDR
jgi:uncharacterized protein (DUF1800 family)